MRHLEYRVSFTWSESLELVSLAAPWLMDCVFLRLLGSWCSLPGLGLGFVVWFGRLLALPPLVACFSLAGAALAADSFLCLLASPGHRSRTHLTILGFLVVILGYTKCSPFRSRP